MNAATVDRSNGGTGGSSNGSKALPIDSYGSFGPIGADVSGYEEYLDTAGNVVTHYVVNVTVNQQSYQLKKRYSEFSELYNNLKDNPIFVNYRFPNKSLFNTHSQFTKERRRQGFDELVKLSSAIRPMPNEVVEFLEIEDDCGPASLGPDVNTTPVKSETIGSVDIATHTSPSPTISQSVNSNIHSVSSPGIETEPKRRMSTEGRLPKGMVNIATVEQEINVQKRDYFLQVLPSSTCLASAAYATLVAANVIDVTSTTTARMAITVVFFAFTLNVFRTLFFESPDHPKPKTQ